MSSLLGAPPARIPIGGPGGGPPGLGPGGPGDDTGGPDADASQVVSMLRMALSLVQQAATLEADDPDAAQISDVAARLHKLIANEQNIKDQAMGAGPAAKMIRKATPPGGGGGGPPSGAGY